MTMGKAKASKVKECPPGKVLNPSTNRCIDVNGKLAKKLGLSSQKKKVKVKTPSPPKRRSPQLSDISRDVLMEHILKKLSPKSSANLKATNKEFKNVVQVTANEFDEVMYTIAKVVPNEAEAAAKARFQLTLKGYASILNYVIEISAIERKAQRARDRYWYKLICYVSKGKKQFAMYSDTRRTFDALMIEVRKKNGVLKPVVIKGTTYDFKNMCGFLKYINSLNEMYPYSSASVNVKGTLPNAKERLLRYFTEVSKIVRFHDNVQLIDQMEDMKVAIGVEQEVRPDFHKFKTDFISCLSMDIAPKRWYVMIAIAFKDDYVDVMRIEQLNPGKIVIDITKYDAWDMVVSVGYQGMDSDSLEKMWEDCGNFIDSCEASSELLGCCFKIVSLPTDDPHPVKDALRFGKRIYRFLHKQCNMEHIKGWGVVKRGIANDDTESGSPY